MSDVQTYPLEGSLGAKVFSSTDAELREKYGISGSAIDPDRPSGPGPMALAHLRKLAAIFSEAAGKESSEDLSVLERFSYSTEYQTLIHWEILPDGETPTSINLGFSVEPSRVGNQLILIGFPLPDTDPATVVGSIHDTHRKFDYKPAPEGLSSLTYAVIEKEAGLYIAVLVERGVTPPALTEEDLEPGTLFYEKLGHVGDPKKAIRLRPGSFRRLVDPDKTLP
jgi:hypothetical protein